MCVRFGADEEESLQGGYKSQFETQFLDKQVYRPRQDIMKNYLLIISRKHFIEDQRKKIRRGIRRRLTW